MGRVSRAAALVASPEVAGDDPGDDNKRKEIEAEVKLDPVIGDKALQKVLHRFHRRKLIKVLHDTASFPSIIVSLLGSHSDFDKARLRTCFGKCSRAGVPSAF